MVTEEDEKLHASILEERKLSQDRLVELLKLEEENTFLRTRMGEMVASLTEIHRLADEGSLWSDTARGRIRFLARKALP